MAGRVVLVTGSTSGIGEAAALRFAAGGDVVVFNSSNSVDEGERLAASVPGSRYVRADISQEGECERLIEDVLAHYGRLDVLVNNAGRTRNIAHGDLAGASIDVWREIFELNVFGTWALSVAAMNALRGSHGCIVNVTSIAGLRPEGSSIPYAASKAALNHMTALLARVVGPEVRVNAVAPGLIDTPWTESWSANRAFVQKVAPLRRTGTPEDIADVIVALAATSYMTGQVVVVDGGLTLAH
ncbi:MAG: SDR family oxidoreductase [Acidimicrobiaceae bacterium]|nr:SDR family oxidoreductase [Acidimicrobiaceae bacterium]